METLTIEKHERTPFVNLSIKGEFIIEGKSTPEDTFEFYKPVLSWLKDYAENPAEKTVLDVKLEYFNTSSSKFLLEVFKILESIRGHKVIVYWHYEQDDEEMLEAGEDYREIIDVDFYLIGDIL